MEKKTPNILITGVTGFAGSAVAGWFLDRGYRVTGPARRPPVDPRIEYHQIVRIDRYTHWAEILKGADVVIHLAARAHQMHETGDTSQIYYETNVEGTENLARQALDAGVTRFIMVSSIKAMLSGASEIALSEDVFPRPADPYGISKLKAEIELLRLARERGLQPTIFRPPLMYGPGVKGNMASLIKLVQRFRYLPLGGIENRRSLLAVKNLASAIEAAVNNPVSIGKTYLLSDGEPISTSELVRRLARNFNPACSVLSLPGWLWRALGKVPLIAGKIEKLSGSLPVDSSLFEGELGWKPPFTMQQQLEEML